MMLQLLLSMALAQQVHAYDVPVNDGFLTDEAGIVTLEQDRQIESMLRAYQQETTNEIAILIIESLNGEAIADVALEVGRAWGVGTSENDNGIMMVISYTDRKLFLATGYGLEGAVPDLVAKGIIDTEIVPFFKEGDYFGGILAGITALQLHIGGEYTADRYEAKESEGLSGALLFFIFFVLEIAGAFLGRTKSWWLGGVFGGIAGIILTALYAWWWSIPVLTLVGLVFDFIVSKNSGKRRRNHYWTGGGRGSGGGGFGGFSGGSFGGGGAGGSW